MKFRLYGDICRACIIEVEAASVEELDKLLGGDPINLDALKHRVVQEERKCATFDWNGDLFNEAGEQVALLPSIDYEEEDRG